MFSNIIVWLPEFNTANIYLVPTVPGLKGQKWNFCDIHCLVVTQNLASKNNTELPRKYKN